MKWYFVGCPFGAAAAVGIAVWLHLGFVPAFLLGFVAAPVCGLLLLLKMT